MTPLDQVEVASPCHESWDEMAGDDKQRFCTVCRKNVYNLSAMTTREAEEFVAERSGKACVRFYRRADGTLLTADCPVGARRIWKRRTISFAGAASVLASATVGLVKRSDATHLPTPAGSAQAPAPSHKTTDVSKGPDPFRVPAKYRVQAPSKRIDVPAEQKWKLDDNAGFMGIIAQPDVAKQPPTAGK